MIKSLPGRVLALALVTFGTAGSAYAFDGQITACHDGDTCTARDQTGQVFRIRLHGVDTPEIGQPYGSEARAIVLRLVLNRTSTCDLPGVVMIAWWLTSSSPTAQM